MSEVNHNIVQLFLDAADRFPNRMAIIEGERNIDYKTLKTEVLETAAYFQSTGLKQGDRVLVFIPMSIDLYRSVLALFYLGATAVFLDEWVSKKRMELCCRIAECNGFIGVTKARIFAWFSKDLRKIPIKLNVRKRSKALVDMAQTTNSTDALITFTTGSTGTPKAARRTHGFLQEQFSALLSELKPKETDIDMPVLPIVLFVNLGVGACSVIAKFNMKKAKAMDAQSISKQISKNKVNKITASPFFIRKLATVMLAHKISLPMIKKIFTGGAAVFSDEAKIYELAFPQAEIKVAYGSTEAEPISIISTTELIQESQNEMGGLPVGDIYENINLKVIEVNPDPIEVDKEEALDALSIKEGHIGEIVVAGDHVLKQYYNNPQAFKENKIVTDQNIWHRTGDSGFVKEGKLYLTGRCKQLIRQNGSWLSPFVIEEKLEKMNGVDKGTLLSFAGNLWLVLESNSNGKHDEAKLDAIPHDKVLYVQEIPRDQRHHSRIDYEAVLSMIKKKA